jgi:transcriptional regulator with XRE-family HTH domain
MAAPTLRKYAIERNYRPVGDYLRQARLKAGLTQKQVADALEYSSAQFISNFEAGIAVPPLRKLVVLEQVYNMNLRELMDIIFKLERESIGQVLAVKPKFRSQGSN